MSLGICYFFSPEVIIAAILDLEYGARNASLVFVALKLQYPTCSMVRFLSGPVR